MLLRKMECSFLQRRKVHFNIGLLTDEDSMLDRQLNQLQRTNQYCKVSHRQGSLQVHFDEMHIVVAVLSIKSHLDESHKYRQK